MRCAAFRRIGYR